MDYSVRNPDGITTFGLAFFPFARRYLGNRFFFLFLRLLRCFSSAGIPPLCYFIHITVTMHEHSRVSTFGNLRVKRIFAPNRSLSQLIASFIGTWCQGIHPALLLAWPNRIIWVYHRPSFVSITWYANVRYSCYLLTIKKTLSFFSNRISIDIFDISYLVFMVQLKDLSLSKINSILVLRIFFAHIVHRPR